MKLTGRIANGVVVLDQGQSLADGTRVRVEPLKRPARGARAPKRAAPVGKRLLRYAGRLKGPPDWAENHDHYIHGTPKR
jgi:hypothetical protein